MKLLPALFFLAFYSFSMTLCRSQSVTNQKLEHQGAYVMVIHSGTGTILKDHMTPEKEQAYRNALETALKAGYAKIKEGGQVIRLLLALAPMPITKRLLFPVPDGRVLYPERSSLRSVGIDGVQGAFCG